MATKKGKFIIGSMGDVVYKEINGVQVMQSKPGKGGVRQTPATKESAGLFGKSSTLASNFRGRMHSVINENADGRAVGRLTAAVNSVIRHCYSSKTKTFRFEKDSFESLAGFDFNIKSPLQKSMWLMPESKLAENILTITLPELRTHEELKFPKGTNLCEISICVLRYRLEEGLEYKKPEVKTVEITSDLASLEEQDLEFNIPEGSFCIAAIGLHYYEVIKNKATDRNSKAFNPAAICAAYMNEGTFKPEEPQLWQYRNKLEFKAASDMSATTNQASPRLRP